jgi:hypothetical protein
VPSDVGAQARNQARNRSCLQNEVICIGMDRSGFVEFPIRRREDHDRGLDLQCANLANKFSACCGRYERVRRDLSNEEPMHCFNYSCGDSAAMNRDTYATCGPLEDDVHSSAPSSGNPAHWPPASESPMSHGRPRRLTSVHPSTEGIYSYLNSLNLVPIEERGGDH